MHINFVFETLSPLLFAVRSPFSLRLRNRISDEGLAKNGTRVGLFHVISELNLRFASSYVVQYVAFNLNDLKHPDYVDLLKHFASRGKSLFARQTFPASRRELIMHGSAN